MLKKFLQTSILAALLVSNANYCIHAADFATEITSISPVSLPIITYNDLKNNYNLLSFSDTNNTALSNKDLHRVFTLMVFEYNDGSRYYYEGPSVYPPFTAIPLPSESDIMRSGTVVTVPNEDDVLNSHIGIPVEEETLYYNIQ